MSVSELVTIQHLQKKAIIYIRQSTPQKPISNQESLRLQYALNQRAQHLGWHPDDIDIIDADLGLTGASAQHRTGCARTGCPCESGAGGFDLVVGGDPPLTQLLRLVSAARYLWLSQLLDRRQ